MQLHLYRPIRWRRGGSCVCLSDTAGISPREAALLIRLKWATYLPNDDTPFGEFMSDDTSSALRLITPPTSEPVTLASAKLFLRVEHTADDEAITRAIVAARQAAELYQRSALMPQTWDYSIANPPPDSIALPIAPAQSITSITLTTEAGATSTMDTAHYRLAVDGRSVLFNPSVSIEKLTVRYIAGIATTVSDIPAAIIQGILHHLAVMMETRNGAAPMPMQSIACYQPYRRISL